MDTAYEGRLVEMAKVLCKYPWIVEVVNDECNYNCIFCHFSMASASSA
jgi:hypothetical protein